MVFWNGCFCSGKMYGFGMDIEMGMGIGIMREGAGGADESAMGF